MRKTLTLGSAVAAGMVVLTACNAAAPNASSGSSQGPQKTGGTLYILGTANEVRHLDPARSYEQASENLSPLFIRTLTLYKPVPGAQQPVVGDLATDAGDPSNNATVWTFHLRKGITYQNGAPITAQDIKYGVERTFEPDLAGGPGYAAQWLVGASKYQGPAADPKGLASIETPNASTIIFKLNRPVPDFNYFTTYPMFSGVPKSLDTGVKYDLKPIASGPYQIQSYSPGKALILTRNPKWNKASDPNRPAYVNEIDYELGLSQSVITQRLIADQGQDQDAIQLDTTIDPASVAAVLNNPSVKPRAVSGATGATEMLTMNTTKAPFTNVKVRQAMEYAVDKDTYVTARGGPVAGGVPTSTLLPPQGMPGYLKYDLYPASSTGDPAKAKQLLASAGYPNGFTVTMDVDSDDPSMVNASEAIQTALQRAGVKVNLQSVSGSTYYATTTSPSTAPQLSLQIWGADWPYPSTFLPPMFDGRLISANANSDPSMLNNPAINAEIDKIARTGNAAKAATMYGQLDKMIMQLAPVVPLLSEHRVFLHGANVQNAFITMEGTFNPLSISLS